MNIKREKRIYNEEKHFQRQQGEVQVADETQGKIGLDLRGFKWIQLWESFNRIYYNGKVGVTIVEEEYK